MPAHKKRHTLKRQWIEAAAIALASGLGVVQALPSDIPIGREVGAVFAAALPVLVFQLRHGGSDPASAVAAAPSPAATETKETA